MVIKSQNLDYLYLDDGEQGVPGQAGSSYYTWIKYAHDSSGTGMTDSSAGMEYIGIAYNKTSATESTTASDYAWSKIQGENGQDGYTVILSNENISFSVGVDSKPLDNQSYTCDITVLIGATPKTDFTVGTPTGVPTGITATTSGKRVTVSVSTSTAIPNNTGSITVPITIDGNTINRVITYSLSVAGVDGDTIVSTTITYAASPYGDILPQSVLTDEHGLIIGDENGNAIGEPEWLPDPPQNVPDGWYVYTRTVFTFASGATSATYAIAKHGDTGTSVSQLTPEYRLSDSSTSLTGSGQGYTWSSVKPEMEVGQFIWERVRNDYSDGTTTYSNPTCDVTMSGVLVNVDNNTKSITNKVWQTDISTAINDYNGGEGSASGTIKDRLSNAEQSIDGFTQTVSEMTTRFDGDEAWIETVETTAEQAADHFTWLVRSGSSQSSLTLTDSAVTAITNQFVIKDPAGSATIIEGGKIKANSITTNMLAANAIKSQNYQASTNAQSPYSEIGTYLDLSNGNFYTPNFGVQGTGGAYINGSIIASSGQIGQNSTNYWEIGNARDYNMTDSAVIQSHGTAYIQAGEWQISNNKINTQKYESNSSSSGNLVYYKDIESNTWYDFGVKLPSDFSAASTSDSTETLFHKSVFYGRKYTGNNIPSFDSQWDYLFQIDVNGNIYENGVKLSDKYAPATIVPDFSGELSINGKTYNGIDDVNVGTIGIAYGGTGKTSWTANGIVYASASNTLSQLGVGTSGYVLKSNGNAAPSWVAQSSLSVGSATSATKATQDGSGNVITSTYRTLANNTFDSATITDLSVGNIAATGVIRATNGIYGDLTGTASEATHAASATTATSATKATQDGNGATISSTYLKLIGGTLTGELISQTGGIWVQGNSAAGGNYNRLTLTSGMPTELKYNGSKRGTRIYSNAIAFADPYNGNSNNDSAWIRHIEETSNSGILEIATGDDTNEAIVVRQYNTSSAVAREAYILNSSGNTSFPGTVTATTFSGKLTSRTITVGNTGKSVDWSGNVSWSKADISGVAQPAANDSTVTSNAGWMSGADKFKLDSITVTSGGQIATKNITVERGLQNASNVEGVYQLGHSNSITAGTTSGTSNTGNVAFGSTVTLPKITYDAYGHITKAETYTFKLPAAPTTITGNAGTATKFASAQSVTLTGDTTGTASSQAGWSIATTTTTLTHKSLDSTTINNTAGTFAFSGSGEPWDGSDWVGLQVGDAYDKFQIHTSGGTLEVRQNDSGGTNSANWTAWATMLTSANYTSYAPTKTGSGASGTWAIGISGNAATATSATKATQDSDGNAINTTYLKLSGGTMTGDLLFGNPGETAIRQIRLQCANNDYGRIAVGGTASNSGYMEIATADDAAEPIYVRQYTGVFATLQRTATLLDASGNTAFPGRITIGSGTSAATNTCQLYMNTTTKSLDFVFY